MDHGITKSEYIACFVCLAVACLVAQVCEWRRAWREHNEQEPTADVAQRMEDGDPLSQIEDDLDAKENQ